MASAPNTETPTPTPTPAPAATEQAPNFDDAFAAAAAEDDETPKEGEGGTPTPTPAASEETPKEGEAAPTPTPTPASAEEAPKPAAADDVVSRLADLLASREQKPADQQTPAAEETPVYTPEDLQTLEDYEKNWPDVAKAEGLRRRAEYHDLLKFVFGEVAKELTPIQEQLRAVGNTLHTGELKAAVPDYSETLEQDVTNWIETQPSYLQGGMKQVMQTGTSEEVADLIGRYRAEKGVAPAATEQSQQAPSATPAPTPTTPAKSELSSAAKQAAESLAPVSGERTQVPAGEDLGDFDSAFSKYAATAME